MDSDDWIDADYIEKNVGAMQENNLEVLCNNKIMRVQESRIEEYNVSCTAWCYFFKKSFLDKTGFVFAEGLVHEDMHFYYTLIRKVQNLHIFSGSNYYYFERENSLVGLDGSRVKTFDLIKIMDLVYEDYKTNNLLDEFDIPLKEFFFQLDVHENRAEFLRRLYPFFKRIEADVRSRVHLYGATDLEFFDNVLNDVDKVLAANYKKKRLFNMLRGKAGKI
jgi:hypothetical protein